MVQTLGAQWIVVPSIPSELHSVEGFKTAGGAFHRGGKAARDAGLSCCSTTTAETSTRSTAGLYDILLGVDPELLGFEWICTGRSTAARPAKLVPGAPRPVPGVACQGHGEDGSWEDVGAGKLDFAAMFQHASGGVEQWLDRTRQAHRCLAVGRAQLPRTDRDPVTTNAYRVSCGYVCSPAVNRPILNGADEPTVRLTADPSPYR